MDPRRQLYWDLHDFSVGHGLEVGPLHRPMVQRDEGDVSYVDVLDREGLLEHYANDPHVPDDDIPEIDFHLIEDGETRSLVEATKAGAPFDWVMASHVIEHVPDLVGWLAEVAEIVKDGGLLVLAIPDKRYCFDAHRPPTTVGELLAANHAGDVRPSIRAVYDHFSSAVDYNAVELWRGNAPTYASRIHSVEEAHRHVAETIGGKYVDCHVWLFTPDSFLYQMRELRQSRLSSWVVEELVPTPLNDIEFRVRMRRIPRDADPVAEADGEVAPGDVRPDWLEDLTRGQRSEAIEQKHELLQRRIAKLRRKLCPPRGGARTARRRTKRQRALLAEKDRETPKFAPMRRLRRGVGKLRQIRRPGPPRDQPGPESARHRSARADSPLLRSGPLLTAAALLSVVAILTALWAPPIGLPDGRADQWEGLMRLATASVVAATLTWVLGSSCRSPDRLGCCRWGSSRCPGSCC